MVTEGLDKMSKMGGAAAPAKAAATAGKAEEKVEEAKEEEKEDVDMGNLFGDDDEYS